MTENLDYAMSVVRHLESVATTPELRAAFNAVQPKVSVFYSSLPLNEALWKSIQRTLGRLLEESTKVPAGPRRLNPAPRVRQPKAAQPKAGGKAPAQKRAGDDPFAN